MLYYAMLCCSKLMFCYAAVDCKCRYCIQRASSESTSDKAQSAETVRLFTVWTGSIVPENNAPWYETQSFNNGNHTWKLNIVTLQDKSTGKWSFSSFPFDRLIPCITLKKAEYLPPNQRRRNEWEKKWWEVISSTHWVFSMNNGKKKITCATVVLLCFTTLPSSLQLLWQYAV